MTDPPAETAPPARTPIDLDCGHRLWVAWGTVPNVAAAEVVRHDLGCARGPGARFPAGPAPWTVRRLESFR